MGLLEETLRGKSLADYTNTQLRLALGAVLYTNTADMWKQYLNQIGYTGDVAQMLQKYYADYNVPSNFRNYINAGASIFNPQNMFSVDAALQGYVYDINDLSTLYLDSAGTTPASVNGAVGLVLDKSKEGVAARVNLTSHSELFTNAAWTKNNVVVTASAGVSPDGTSNAFELKASASTTRHDIINVPVLTTVSGSPHTVSAYLKEGTQRYAAVQIISAGGVATWACAIVDLQTGTITQTTNGSLTSSVSSAIQSVGSGWYRVSVTATMSRTDLIVMLGPINSATPALSGNYGIAAYSWAAAGTETVLAWGAQLNSGSSALKYQKVIANEGGWLAGNHAYQATTGNKPVLRGTPVGGNIVTNGDFASDVSGWSALGGGSISWQSGKVRVTKLTGANYPVASQTISLTSGRIYRIKATYSNPSALTVYAGLNGIDANFGTATSGGIEFYTTATGSTTAIQVGVRGTSGTDGQYIDFDNIEVHDVSAGQVQAPYALQFDGSDDFLQTASVNFTATDKMTLCHGVRKLADVTQVIAELSAAWTANAGSFALYQDTSLTQLYASVSRGTAAPAANQGASVTTTYTAPRLSVVSSTHDIVGDSTILRVDGAQVGSGTGDKGAGNFGNYAFYFGRKGGTSLPYNGLFFSAICVGKATSATELANIERWVNLRTGAY